MLCKHDNLEDIRQAVYLAIQKTCDESKLTLQFTGVFLNIVWSVLGTIEKPVSNNLSAPTFPERLAQQDIGY